MDWERDWSVDRVDGEEPFRIVARGRKAKTFADAVVKGPID